MKVCKFCGLDSTQVPFPLLNGVASGRQCRRCNWKNTAHKRTPRPRRTRDIEKEIATRKRYAASHVEENRRRASLYLRENPEARQRIAKWKRSNPEREKEYYQRRKSKPEQQMKDKARWTIANAIRDGRVKRLPCEVCGNPESEAHHEDYSKPLDVRFLCTVHHGMLSRKHLKESEIPELEKVLAVVGRSAAA